MKGKVLLYITSALALASIGYYFYEKQRVKALNERVDSLEDALKKLEESKKQSETES